MSILLGQFTENGFQGFGFLPEFKQHPIGLLDGLIDRVARIPLSAAGKLQMDDAICLAKSTYYLRTPRETPRTPFSDDSTETAADSAAFRSEM